MSNFTSSVQIEHTTLNEFVQFLVSSIIDELKKINIQSSSTVEEELLTRLQVLKLLNVSEPTLWSWERKKKIIAYQIGGKKFYKKHEILNSLKSKI